MGNEEVKDMSWVVGKIGFCLDENLGIIRKDNKKATGHFVYIHDINKNNKCTVSTFISMYNDDGSVKASQIYKGFVLPIPRYASRSFKSFTGLTKHKIKNVDVSKITAIGKFYITNNFIKAYKSW